MNGKILKIRPYARLLTMLGEQLIKNEQIALAELIKNAYDADAEWVRISFVDFRPILSSMSEKTLYEDTNSMEDIIEIEAIPSKSKIIIEDNGCGMDLATIEKSWMNPATPNKRARRDDMVKRTPKGRVVQGEKGIGRFAVLKLGRDITITTRSEGSDEELVIRYDFAKYDDDFLSEDGAEKELFLDDIDVSVTSQQPKVIIDREVIINSTPFKDNVHGTRIEITNLKGIWNLRKIREVEDESQKLGSIFDKIFGKKTKDVFQIGFELNSKRLLSKDNVISRLSALLTHSAVLRITNGVYDERRKTFSYDLNGNPYILSLNDPRLVGLKVFRDYFCERTLFDETVRRTECGNFCFNFFVFDFTADKESPYYLDKNDKEIVRAHRIYLYRDKIRVAPYGDADNDWLETDKKRGTGRTGDYLSNDQVVGFVDITKQDNPNLKDKTNREGLIEKGRATRDFVMLLHSFLLFIRQHPYSQYKETVKKQHEQQVSKYRIVENHFAKLRESIAGNAIAISAYNDVLKSYNIEREFYRNRLDVTEELAGVGLSVETASHDMMMMLSKGLYGIDSLVKDIESNVANLMSVGTELRSLQGTFLFVQDQMKNIQLLFRSSKQRRRIIKVYDILERVIKIYDRTLKREGIQLTVVQNGTPILAKCTDAVILQLLINLFDNSVYWLSTVNVENKLIKVTLDGETQKIIFSDNGPGIRYDDEPYIFEAFYSGKEDGRGLGLYIAKQLLNRMGYTIYLANTQTEQILSGANFVINFVIPDKND